LNVRIPKKLALVAFALVLGCHDSVVSPAPPLNRFYYPTGIAVRHEPVGCSPGTAGCRTQLLVVSSNWDLAYDPSTGGTLLSVDVDQALTNAAAPGAPSPIPAPVTGAVRIGSFGGELAILDGGTCSTWTGNPQALVASRSLIQLYRVDIASNGALTCGSDCIVPLDKTLADPYGVSVVCGSFPTIAGAAPSPQALAFVTYLRAVGYHGWLSQVDLAAGSQGARTSPFTSIDLGLSPTGTSFYDAASTRLYVTGRFGQANYAPVRWIELASPGTAPAVINLGNQIRGADLRGFALSSDGQRAFVAARLYDVDYAAQYGVRPSTDLGGALLVLDAAAMTGPLPTATILQVIPLDRGLSEVRVIPRPGLRDLVAVTSSDDSTLTLYDDEQAQVARTFTLCGASAADANAPGPCNTGAYILGTSPFGIAIERMASGRARLYVGSFNNSWINLIEIDPMHPTAPPSPWIRIGAERPT
jgi:hypothetical protein